MGNTKSRNIVVFITSIIICELAGVIGAVFTASSVPTWYASLNKPFITPPSEVFGPAWTTLYFLMGLSAFLVWRLGWKVKGVKIALSFFIIQLILNALWTFIFFGLKSPLYAFIEIIVLWISIVLTIIFFFKLSRSAGILLIPYILWVSFAAFLNFLLWRLNS